MTDTPAFNKSRAHFMRRASAPNVRDEWIAGVLDDVELSPTQRMIGAYIGLAVDFNNWPSTQRGMIGPGGIPAIAARLGLPTAVVIKACNALVRRRWIIVRGRDSRLHGFDLTDGGRS